MYPDTSPSPPPTLLSGPPRCESDKSLAVIFLVAPPHPHKDLLRRIFNDGYPQSIMVSKIALLPSPLGHTLDLFYFFDFKTRLLPKLFLDQQCDQHSPLAMRMYAASSPTVEGSEEQWRTGGRFQSLQCVKLILVVTFLRAWDERLHMEYQSWTIVLWVCVGTRLCLHP